MSNIRTSCHHQVWMGLPLFLVGLCGESVSGIWLFKGGDLRSLLLHVLAVLIWAFGINLIWSRGRLWKRPTSSWHTFVNKWTVGALLLGLFTFPGSGSLMYSVALAIAILLQRKKRAISKELEPVPENVEVSETAPQLTIDILQGTDIETRRVAIAALSRQGTPEAMQALRQLLLDSDAQIRTDASIALTHLEERLSRSLNTFFQEWMKNPSNRESTLNLADQYYQYAQSNVLDEASQHFYLLKALDLLHSVTTQGATEPDLWLKQARIRQRLNKCEEALQDVRVALQLSPHTPDACVLAMELAFELSDWYSLIAFGYESVGALPETSGISEYLQQWATLQAEPQGESIRA